MAIPKILLLDDDTVDREFIRRLLHKQEKDRVIEIHEAATCDEAFSLMESINFDCFIIDYNLPAMGGIQLCRKIHKMKDMAFAPIMMVTGVGDEALAVKALKQGVCNYISKKSLPEINLYQLILKSIKESDQMRRGEEKREDLELFVNTVAHDISSPLRNLLYVIENLEHADQSKPLSHYINNIDDLKKSTLTIVKMIENLQNSCVAGREAPNLWIDVGEVIQLTLNNLSPLIAEKQAKIVLSESFPRIFANFEPLLQLFQNLISNALKFSKPNATPIIEITGKKIKDLAHIFIKDNGIGINEEDVNSVFNTFTRGHNVEDIEGTGLGLSLCRKIVKQLNGTMSVESKLGMGTTFCVMLPCK